jgi:hypothetical protein
VTERGESPLSTPHGRPAATGFRLRNLGAVPLSTFTVIRKTAQITLKKLAQRRIPLTILKLYKKSQKAIKICTNTLSSSKIGNVRIRERE